jgi:hypothetical protein
LLEPRSPLFEEATGEAQGGGGGEAIHMEPQEGAESQQPALTLESLLSVFQEFSSKLPDTIKETVSRQVNGLDARWDKRWKALEASKKAEAPKPAAGASDTDLERRFFEEREKEMRERLETLEAQAREKERLVNEMQLDSEIKSVLSEFPWESSNGRSEGKEIAFDYYKAKAKRNDEGQLVIGDIPLSQFIKQHAAMSFKSHFQKRDIGSSGAQKSGTAKGAFDIESIRPGMSKEDDAAAQAAIIAALQGLRR